MAGFLIRDALPVDIPGCMGIDHTYETDLVWQMNIFQDTGPIQSWQITFRTERLPRTLEATYAADERRLQLALAPESCFLVAVERSAPTPPPMPPVINPEPIHEDFNADEPSDDSTRSPEDAALPPENPQPSTEYRVPSTAAAAVYGYLTMRYDPARRTAWVQDIVVDAELRRGRIGTRLLNAARRWAGEQGAQRIMVELTTRNYPAIAFCGANGLTFCGYNDQYFDNHDIAVFFGDDI